MIQTFNAFTSILFSRKLPTIPAKGKRSNTGVARNSSIKISKWFPLLMLTICSILPSYAQDTDFWFAAPDDSNEHGQCDRPTFLMISTSIYSSTVEIYIGGSLRRKVNIPPNSFHRENFISSSDIALVENSIANNVAGTVQNKGIHIKASNPVTAYYQVNGSCSKDIFTLKGKRALGTHFFTPFQTRYGTRSVFSDAYNHFAIVATEDNTNITIQTNTQPNPASGTGTGSIIYRPAGQGGNIASGTAFTITLNKGQTYTVRENSLRGCIAGNNWWGMDKPTLSGTEVTATKPIAITVAEPGTTMASTWVEYPATDLLGDQIVPVEGLGTNYIVVPGFKSGTAEEWVYLMATEDNTNITVHKHDGTTGTVTLNKGQHWTYLLDNNGVFFLADKPSYCYHQSAADHEMGAAILPSMFAISSRSISFYKQSTDVDNTYLFLIFRKGAEGGFTRNGNTLSIPSSSIKNIPSINDWVYAKVTISSTPEGLCVIENSKSAFAMGIFSYKTTTTTSYGFMSDFGYFSFSTDTTYKCIGDPITLDAGYASTYAWELPDGSTANTSNVTSSLEGWYKVTVNQDTYTIIDSIYVKDRFGDINTDIVGARFRIPGETYKYHVDFRPEYISNVTYEWSVTNGSINLITPDTIEVTWTNDGVISLVLQDTLLGCRKELHLPVTSYPDNIVDADCYITPPATTWSIKEVALNKNVLVQNYGPLVVGDIDGDGVIEIIGYKEDTRSSKNYESNGIKIFYYNSGTNLIELKKEFLFSTTGGATSATCGAMAIARYDNKDYIVVAGTDKYLYAYDTNGNRRWKSNAQYNTNTSGTILGIADFNNDGIPEVYTGNQIFSLSNGKMLCDGGTTNSSGILNPATGHSTVAADMDGDGTLEIVAGVNIYKITITNNDGTSGNSISLLTGMQLTATLPTYATNDGATQVVDIDHDGKLEVVVISLNSGRCVAYVWKPLPNNQSYIMGSYLVPASNVNDYSIPMLGNIDNEPYPEIVFITNGTIYYMYALEFNPTASIGNQLSLKWNLSHTDASGCTGATLFDFNQDGRNEIVYRDQTNLRIIDGSSSTASVMATFNNVESGTLREYPVIADIDGDGQAEIVVTGGDGLANTVNGIVVGTQNGYIRLFKTNGSSWAPARKVWNQYAYNAVNVNEDLTIPKIQMSPAMVFPGDDGILETADDVRPYNAFLQQQTFLSKNGTPLWLTPNGEVTGMHAINYDVNADSLSITIEVRNIGDAAFQPPFYITTYKNSIGGTPKHTISYDQAIVPGETVSITFGIPNFTQNWYPFNNIIIQINDNGNGDNDQAVCDDANRFLKTTNIIASDDRVLIFTDDVNRPIEVTLNDLLPASCTNPTIQVLSVPSYTGTASVSGSDILYTPATGVTADTLRYRIHCGDVSQVDTATVYINIIEKPDNIIDADCWIEPKSFEWGIKTDYKSPSANHHNYAIPLVGDVDGDGIPEIVTINSNTQYINILWGHSKTITTIKMAVAATLDTSAGGSLSPYAMFRTQINGVDKSVLVVKGTAAGTRVDAYDLNGAADQSTSPLWTNTSGGYFRENISIVDFDGDGIPEVYISDRIYNAHTGDLLVSGSGNKGYCINAYFTVAADINNDGKLELIAGNEVYSVHIPNKTGTTGNSLTRIAKMQDNVKFVNGASANDGFTVVADINNDGNLDVIYLSTNSPGSLSGNQMLIAWDPVNETLIFKSDEVSTSKGTGVPFVGNIDDDPDLEVVFMVANRLLGYKPNIINGKFDLAYSTTVDDESGSTGMTLFDFNNDGKGEIVYRDQTLLRIMQANPGNPGSFSNLKTYSCTSTTALEYPVIADVDNDGASEIIVIGNTSGYVANGFLWIYKSGTSNSWAPARKVWNQYAYNVVNVNEDLTIPKQQLNPATIFPGNDRILGTTDDVRPFNAFLQQQTTLNNWGIPLWLTPDVYPDPSLVSSSIIGDSVSITIGMINQGDAVIGPPIYVSLYKESLSVANRFAVDSANIQIMPGDTGYVTIRIPDIQLFLPMTNIVVRINDKGVDFTDFTYQPECDDTNNVITILNPAMNLMMKKSAKLEGIPHNGTYSNPVSVLYNEDIEYTITAVNANITSGRVIIRDTLPPYLKYKSSSPTITPSTNGSNPSQVTLEWTINGVASMATTSVKVVATPEEGCVSSQPMFINRAWVLVSDTIYVPTNYTYHQGACLGVATFSAGFGGNIYNAIEQALDYKTAPRSGIIIVPNEGYRFTGWSHDDYISLRNETIKAQKEIMYYDTLTVYGNINLHANFEPEEYPVRYYLNDSKNAANNPSTYTIETKAITLEAPQKAGDVFIGWTGSNGEEPQQNITIAGGSTGELEFYANFLYSGCENIKKNGFQTELNDRDTIWASENTLYIKTFKVGSIVRIYSVEGILREQYTITTTDVTSIQLPRGIYIVTLNNDFGHKINIK